jgi:cystathionine gamma-synthase
MSQQPERGLSTWLVHAGERLPPPVGRPTATPVYTTSTYVHPSARALDAAFAAGTEPVYSRNLNPTLTQVEVAMQVIESGAGAVMFASGMAALHAAVLAAGTPDGENQPRFRGVVCGRDLYGATTTLVEQFLPALGIPVVPVNTCDLSEVELALRAHRPNVLLAEQLSNPLLRVIDVLALARLAHEHDAKLIVDNTFATPMLERPLLLGADFSVHSATKYLGGHGDVVGGAVVARTQTGAETLRRYLKLVGSILGPFEATFVGRGIKTLGLRVERQCHNAALIAEFLQRHPRVEKVHFPGMTSHPQHELARRCFGGRFGAMVSFELCNADKEAVYRLMDQFELIWPATSLGDVYTLVTAPFISSHRDLSPAERLRRHIPDSLLRLSLGIEDAEDIRQDLEQALAKLD